MALATDPVVTAGEIAAHSSDLISPEEAKEIPDPKPRQHLKIIKEKREDTRGRLALAFLLGFFIILLSSIIVAAFDPGDKVAGVKDVVLTVS